MNEDRKKEPNYLGKTPTQEGYIQCVFCWSMFRTLTCILIISLSERTFCGKRNKMNICILIMEVVSIDSAKDLNSPMLQKENEIPVGEGPVDQTLVSSIAPAVLSIPANQLDTETPSMFSTQSDSQGWVNSKDDDGGVTGWPPILQGNDSSEPVLRLRGPSPDPESQANVNEEAGKQTTVNITYSIIRHNNFDNEMPPPLIPGAFIESTMFVEECDQEISAQGHRISSSDLWKGFPIYYPGGQMDTAKDERMLGQVDFDNSNDDARNSADGVMAIRPADDGDASINEEFPDMDMRTNVRRSLSTLCLPDVPNDESDESVVDILIDHVFPCMCANERCDGKRLPKDKCKKDARTWLWKSKEARLQALAAYEITFDSPKSL